MTEDLQPEKMGKGDKANLFINTLSLIALSVGGYLAKEIYQTSNETRQLVAVIQAEQKHYVSDTSLQAQLSATRDSIQAQLESIRARITANEIEVIKLQQQKHL